MNSLQILTGHTSKETAYVVKDYPYGRKKCTKYYWIETRPNYGDRMATQTINPKSGRHNAVKYSPYSTFSWLYLDENNHVQSGNMNFRDHTKEKSDLEFIYYQIGVKNVSLAQRANIWNRYFETFQSFIIYERKYYSPALLPTFDQWAEGKRKHIGTCLFAEILAYPDQPARDILQPI